MLFMSPNGCSVLLLSCCAWAVASFSNSTLLVDMVACRRAVEFAVDDGSVGLSIGSKLQ